QTWKLTAAGVRPIEPLRLANAGRGEFPRLPPRRFQPAATAEREEEQIQQRGTELQLAVQSLGGQRSEERRVGKEWRGRGGAREGWGGGGFRGVCSASGAAGNPPGAGVPPGRAAAPGNRGPGGVPPPPPPPVPASRDGGARRGADPAAGHRAAARGAEPRRS